MKTLVFATGNLNKIKEVQKILEGQYQIVPMSEIGCTEDIPETSPTFEGNALQKARYLYTNYQVDCFSEDTGLEVDQLNGEPGVYSARYAGDTKNADANIQLVLDKLGDHPNRKARFRTAIALILQGQEYVFTGVVEGHIDDQKTGEGGFGYDPIFIPEGYEESFAVLPAAVKNQISHRARAVAKLVDFLQNS